MKFYFNSIGQFIEQDTSMDLFVKGNNGNVVECYFKDLDISNTNLKFRLIIKWSDGSTTNELPMNKSLKNDYVYLGLPVLKESGNTEFIIRIYDYDTIQHTAIFSRVIQDNINSKDDVNVSNDEYLILKGLIESTNQDLVNMGKNKQDILVSGVNIKTINGQSILGDGDIVIVGGGSGGGTSSNNVIIETVSPLTQSVAVNSEVSISFDVKFSVGDKGIVYVYGNDVLKEVLDVFEGFNTINVTKAITTKENVVKLMIVDSVGASSSISYLINTVELRIASNFDDSRVYTGDIDFRYTPYGDIEKKIHFEIDDQILEPELVYTSGETLSKTITNLSVGVHKLKVYMTALIDDKKETFSNELDFNLMVTEQDSEVILISSKFNTKETVQGELLSIDYIVYNPTSQTTNVKLKINDEEVNNVNVGRVRQYWNLTDYPVGFTKFTIEVDENNKLEFNVMVEKAQVDIRPVETNLELYLNAKNRSNNESAENIVKWSYGNINAILRNFNFATNGWLTDNNGNNVLRINGEAQVEIPFSIFATDFLDKGKTIEFDFSTTDIYDINKVLVTCFDGVKGFKITSNDCILKSELTTVETKFKEDERVRVSFVIEPTSTNRLVKTYINGVLSGLAQYPTNDDFTQNVPVTININPEKNGSIDIYSIKIYNVDLNNKQILNNYMYELKISEQVNSFIKNDILDDYGKVSYNKIKNLIPILTITGDLPASKGDEKVVNVVYKNPFNSTYNFEYNDVKIDIQGTSSQFYPRKNYKIKFNDYFSFYEGAVEEKTYTFKADYMESSHSHNTGNAKLMNLLSPKFPTQTNNSGVRNAINGFPIVIFVKKNATAEAEYYGVFNFNNDKGNTNTLGLTTTMSESWEFKNNTSARCLFRSNDFVNKVSDDFEARYPKDYTNYTNLSRVVSWVYSTENDIDKFKNEFEQYFNKDFCLFYYIMMEVILAVDSRAKNMFLDTVDGQIWYPRWYDIDTSYGLNNEGANQFSYGLEQHDFIEDVAVFNGENSLLWNNFELAYAEEIKTAYNDYRSNKGLSYETIIDILYGEQVSKISENMYNTDGQFKYVEPLVKNNDATYLYVEQGNRINHLQYWLSNRFKYLDSKYEYSDFKDDFISMRTYTPDNYVVAPTNYFDLKYFTDGYAQVLFGSSNVRERTKANEVVRITAPEGLTFNNTETIIYGASKVLDIGDVSTKYARTMDYSKATKLKRLKIGNNTSGYANTNLEALTIGNNTMLEYLNIENCSKLTQAIDLTGCLNIKEVYAKGSSVVAVNFASGGNLTNLQLPATITNLTLTNQPFLTDFSIENVNNISTLRFENVPNINIKDIVVSAKNLNRIRITNVDWVLSQNEQELLNRLMTAKGLDENNNNIDKPLLTGKIHINGVVAEPFYAEWTAYFGRDLVITVDELKTMHKVKFVDYKGDLLYETLVEDGTKVTYIGETPTKPMNEELQEKYTFSGWTPDINQFISQPTTFEPVFSIKKYYKVTFKNWNGTILQISYVDEGWTAVYEGATPTRPNDEEGYQYTFSGWDKLTTNVTEDMTITAIYLKEEPTVIGLTFDADTNFSMSIMNIKGRVEINWGDGSDVETKNNTTSSRIELSHTYTAGEYDLSFVVKDIIKLDSSEGQYFYPYSGIKNNMKTIKFQEGVCNVISSSLFANNKLITSVKLPKGIKEIKNQCFYNCSNLENLEFNDDLEIINGQAFQNTNFTNTAFKFPYYLKAIGSEQFGANTSPLFEEGMGEPLVIVSFTKVKPTMIVKGLLESRYTSDATAITVQIMKKDIDEYLSDSKWNINSLIVLKNDQIFNLESEILEYDEESPNIAKSVVNNHSNLKKIILPKRPKNLNNFGKNIIDDVYYPSNLFDYLSLDYCISGKKLNKFYVLNENNEYYDLKSQETIIVPNGIETIPETAFYYYNQTKTIVIPESVKTIGQLALYFGSTSNKVTLIFKSTTPPTVYSSSSLPEKNYIQEIRVPASVVEDYKTATNWTTYASIIVADTE